MSVLTVTQLNIYIRSYFEDNPIFRNVYICGEISNFVHYTRSGHFYFTLKDENSQIKAVMFSSYNDKVKFLPQNGMKVLCRGKVSSYERDGIYQLYVEDMQPDGLGALNLAYEQLKEKLANEGLFDEERKRPIPKYPSKIGVVTSNMGAAVQDITKILARRFPVAEVIIYPALVQGNGSADDIVRGIDKLNMLSVDVIIVGRGGGSIEDLWSFNTEKVARAVAKSAIPTISAVGHETDFTICDFVADLRAATPSAAAELAVPDRYNEQVYIYSMLDKMNNSVLSNIEKSRLKLDSIVLDNSFILKKRDEIKNTTNTINQAYVNFLVSQKNELRLAISKINSLNPLSVMERGFSVVTKNQKIITSKKQVKKGDTVEVKFQDGIMSCIVDEVQK